jgi:hypothetical protein
MVMTLVCSLASMRCWRYCAIELKAGEVRGGLATDLGSILQGAEGGSAIFAILNT